MIIGACAAVLGTAATGSLALGLAGSIAGCGTVSIAFWFVIEKLRCNPIIAGLGLTGIGLGGTDLAIQAVYGVQGAVQAPSRLPRIEGLGAFSSVSVLVSAMPLVVYGLWLLLRRTRFGLRLAAAGEHPFAARSVGAEPSRMRLIALIIGGVLCALGGAELALGNLQSFSINMTAGRGYMAFSAALFGLGHPVYSAIAALFFAVVDALGIRAQIHFGNAIPQHLLLMLPYIATVLGVWLSTRIRGRSSIPAAAELRDH